MTLVEQRPSARTVVSKLEVADVDIAKTRPCRRAVFSCGNSGMRFTVARICLQAAPNRSAS